MRPSRAAAALAAWRARRLDVLVVPAGALPPLEVADYAAASGDARARLLDRFGEPSLRTP